MDREIELAGNRQSDGEQESGFWQSDEEAEGQDDVVELGKVMSNHFCNIYGDQFNPSKSSIVTIVQENDKATKFYTGLVSWKLFEYVLNFLAKSQ